MVASVVVAVVLLLILIFKIGKGGAKAEAKSSTDLKFFGVQNDKVIAPLLIESQNGNFEEVELLLDRVADI